MTDLPMLGTARLLLRRMTPFDGPALFALDLDPEVVRYAEPELMHAPRSLADVERTVLRGILAAYDAVPPAEWWSVAVRDGGASIGWVFLRPLDERAWELGYRFRRSAWGRGYATEACRVVLEHGFEERGIDVAVALIDPEHAASQRVAEKLGMRRAGELDGDLRFEVSRG
jgi:RimJ/RimL family protein N-acetyltransferase